MTPQEYRRIQSNKEQELYAARAQNEQEWTKFFMSLYEVETDRYCPMTLSEAFPGVDIPDIRKPGNSLKELYPNYFTGVPSSEASRQEFKTLMDLYRKVEAIASDMARRADALCAQ